VSGCLPPVPLRGSDKPRVCGGAKKLNVKDLALTTVFAALYAALVIGLAGISFQLVQVRVADALIPLSIIFGWPAVIGVTVGCVISNIVSPLPSVLVDITFGAIANFSASLLAWRVSLHLRTKDWLHHFLGCLAAVVIVTFVVGTYLAVITGMELWVWYLGIGIGSLISICGIGYPLLETLKRIRLK
jgi:uncharacterized membrane protein